MKLGGIVHQIKRFGAWLAKDKRHRAKRTKGEGIKVLSFNYSKGKYEWRRISKKTYLYRQLGIRNPWPTRPRNLAYRYRMKFYRSIRP
ncbi:hypothetical protein HF1_09540 [Mycoplasma haemofelis str. Langford 1]|uniref:Uncharacterized protein n=2 Tax=Mycoplasma haemofelis TaxID=29501 RepID=F6FJ93_MYCHI|nr:hypothetical protein MHF_1041 [Mycoplasma haemofelis Ohio2]CBY92962.1 hypothetical protein HF1_09540 [Mycoplasma haemofelis str. Langford 1]